MKKLSRLHLKIILLFLFSTSIHWNSNSNPLCPIAFDRIIGNEIPVSENTHLELAIKAQDLAGEFIALLSRLRQYKSSNNEESQVYKEIQNYEESQNYAEINILANKTWAIVERWEANGEQKFFPLDEFITLNDNIKNLEKHIKPLERFVKQLESSWGLLREETADDSNNLLNAVIDNNTAIEPNKIYTVKPTASDHDFYVLFTSEMEKMINQKRTDIRISRSLNTLLKGPVLGANNSTGIKRLTDQRGLFEIKIMGNKGVGNFRIGLILYKGIYYVVKYTYHHIERQNSFIKSLDRVLQQAIASDDPVFIP